MLANSQEIGSRLSILEMLFQNAPVGYSFVDRDFRFVRVNATLAAIVGRTPPELVGQMVAEVVPSLWPVLNPLYKRALAGETILNYEVSGVAAPEEGSVHHWLASYYPLSVQGEVIGIGVIVNDITERKNAEEELRTRNHLHAMLARANRAVSHCESSDELFQEICEIAVETGRFQFAWVGTVDDNRITKIASAGSDDRHLNDIVLTLDEDDIRSQGPMSRAARTGRCQVVNDFMTSSMTAPWHELAKRDGVAASAAFPLKERGRTVAVLSIYSTVPGYFTDDMVKSLGEITPSISFALDRFAQESDRKRNESELTLRDRAIKAVSQGILITDPRRADNPIIYASPGFERLTGYSAEEVIGKNCRFMQGAGTDPAAIAQVRNAIRDGRGCMVELLNYRKDGNPFWNHLVISAVLDESGRLTNFVGVQTDVTERRRLEDEIQHAQKMDAIGQLAGGIAHDFNNLVTVINGSTEFLLDSIPPDDPKRAILEEIRNAADRSAALTRQLLVFSRKQVLAPKVLDLNEIVRDTEKMLRRIIGEDVQLYTLLAPDLDLVRADPGQLQQILFNLIVNARDAMPSGGKLTIHTDNVELSEAYCQSNPDIRPGQYVLLTVADTGTGMTEEVKSRLFEPFFTTKETGKGTGLGLAVVHGIVKQNDGIISIVSEPGMGTLFKIFLPQAGKGSRTAKPPLAIGHAPRGFETVLLAEDDDAVRTLTRVSLQCRGYTVLEARQGDEAIRVATQHHGPIQLLITDVVMPGVGGRILAELLLTLRPKMRVLYMSGYMDDAVMRHGIQNEQVNFLQKPFSSMALACKVREVLAN